MIHIDVFIVSSFFIFSLFLNFSSKESIYILQKDSRKNANSTISTQVVAILGAMIGSGFLFYHIEYLYQDGLYYILPFFLFFLSTLCISRCLALRLHGFLKHYSIAESMGVLFGKKVRIITALLSIYFSIGIIVLQFVMIHKIIRIYVRIDSQHFVYAVLGVMFLYVLIKYINATSFTNYIQLIFFLLLPVTLFIKVLINVSMQSNTIPILLTYEDLNIKQIIGWHPKFRKMLSLCFLNIIPDLNPAVIRSIYSASTVWQVRKMFNYVSLIFFIMVGVVSLLAILLRVHNTNLNVQEVVSYLISLYSSPLLQELLCIGILVSAMRMVDLYFSTVSLLFIYDIVPFFKILCDNKSKIAATRVCVITTGIIVMFLFKLYQKKSLDFFTSIVLLQKIYLVIVIPFLIALLGFQPKPRAVLLGMGAGCITILLSKIHTLEIYLSGVSGMIYIFFVEVFVLLSSHYWLRGESHTGWVGIQGKLPLLLDQQEKQEARRKLIYSAIENTLLSAQKIFCLYGIYILCTYSIIWYCFATLSYYDIAYYTAALLWGIFFIRYAWYRVPIKKMNSWMVFFWLGGLIVFLFIATPLYCIIHNYHVLCCILLFTNFIMAYLLWPLSFVITMTLGGFFCSILCWYYNIITLSATSWQEDYTMLVFVCTTITTILLIYIRAQKIIAHQKLKNKYIEELQIAQDSFRLPTLQSLQFNQRMFPLFKGKNDAKLDDLFSKMQVFFDLYSQIKDKEIQKEYLYKLRKIYEIPCSLQERYYYDQECLPFTIESIVLTDFMREIKKISKVLGYSNRILYNPLPNLTLYGDRKQLRQLLITSIEYLGRGNKKCNIIKLSIQHTTLQYELKVATQDNSNFMPALAIYLTTDHAEAPKVASYYQVNFVTPLYESGIWEHECIINAHYGYINTIENAEKSTLLYVIPLDLRKVRNKFMNQVPTDRYILGSSLLRKTTNK